MGIEQTKDWSKPLCYVRHACVRRISAKAAFDAPNTQHWTLNALNMLQIALTHSDCCTVYIEYTKEVQQYTPKTKFSLFFEHNILTECPG